MLDIVYLHEHKIDHWMKKEGSQYFRTKFLVKNKYESQISKKMPNTGMFCNQKWV